jgi:hypothetical protein
LVRRHHEYLRDGDWGFGRLVILFESGGIRDKLRVHVHKEVMPVRVQVDEGSSFDVKLEQCLQMVV